LLISPGEAFIADGAQLAGPLAAQLTTAATVPVTVTGWTPDRRGISVPRSPVTRVLVVPESVNPGWVARTADGAALTPVIVNGWQQGWVVPAGEQGAVTLSFPSNATYRWGLTAGLCLLPVLLAMALVPGRRPVREYLPAHPRAPGLLAVAGLLGIGALIAGTVGLVVFGCALAVGFLMRHRQPDFDRLTLFTVPAGVILAGALLSRHPWRSVDGYIGHSPWVQIPALIALGALAASLVARPAAAPRAGSDPEEPAES
jgi:arabinofuranan 3-O-arabinosyltransferase